jgi:hypothetical protein
MLLNPRDRGRESFVHGDHDFSIGLARFHQPVRVRHFFQAEYLCRFRPVSA